MKESYYKPLIINITYRKSANNNLFKSLPLTLSSSKLITNCMPPLKLIPLIINLDSNLIKCYKLTLYYKDKNSHSESWIKAFKFKSKTLNTKKINSNLITNKNINLFKDKSSKEIILSNKYKLNNPNLINSKLKSKNLKIILLSINSNHLKREKT